MSAAHPHRFRLRRAGVLNVWQYDEQVFDIDGGRMLLRGTNGAGKSKTLEMLLPFVLDGDKARMTASGRHHTSLLWLMLDGYDGAARTGYLWVEFERTDDEGRLGWFTCGVGLRASQSARQASAWFFTTSLRVGDGLELEDTSGPLSRDRLAAQLGDEGQLFDSAPRYREHVGRALFGLDSGRYDELLRLLYWLRQPQVGEDIEPARLAAQLVQALPQVDDTAVRAAGDTFDELEAFGEQIDRMERSAAAVTAFVEVYAGYARQVVSERAEHLVEAHRELGRRTADVTAKDRELAAATEAVEQTERTLAQTDVVLGAARRRRAELETSPEARTQQRLLEMAGHVERLAEVAERARRVADDAARRAQDSRDQVNRHGDTLGRDLAREQSDVTTTSSLMTRSGWGRGLAPGDLGGGDQAGLREPSDGQRVRDALGRLGELTRAEATWLGELQAAVHVVQHAQAQHADAVRAVRGEERAHAEAQARAEQASEMLARVRERVSALEAEYLDAVNAWITRSPGVQVRLPEMDATGLAGLGASVVTASAPLRDELAARVARATDRLDERAARRDELTRRRDEVEAERDPRPPAPLWSRDDRSGLDGAPLWRLVDFRPDVEPAVRAGVEAALEASGLLDAWVRPDGTALDGARLDVALPLGPAVPGPTLADVLVPDVDAPGVHPGVVTGLLERIAWERPEATAVDGTAIDGAGRWWLGALHGRAQKAQAQYVGAGARATERARRLADIDAELVVVGEQLFAAQAELDVATKGLRVLGGWLAELPRHEGVLTGWAELGVQEQALSDTAAAERQAAEGAERARRAAAQALTALDHLAAQHHLPRDPDGLASRREQLVEVGRAFERHGQRATSLADAVERWEADLARCGRDEVELDTRLGEARHETGQLELARAGLDEMREALGAGVAALQERLAQVRRDIDENEQQQSRLRALVQQQVGARGGAQQAVRGASERRDEAREPVAEAARAFARTADVPGLLRSALGTLEPGRAETIASADTGDGAPTHGAPPRGALTEARRLLDLPAPERPSDANAVLAAWQQLMTGPAAGVDPRAFDVHGVTVFVGRDEAGEHPVTVLADRLQSAVEENRGLLTERERRLFEDHVLGHLGESLRLRRLEADELVSAMNDLLAGVTTSQGIRVRLRWRLREDIPADAARAVALLGEPLGALLPDERRDLRDALHRLIEASRQESPEDSYAEHLARALDYRQWFAFSIRYQRPESAGVWHELHRRSPLSQGEQKVVCYLPLFAAAAAHFTSVAGAAPHAPRLVLLDDAFPKIDARTHPLLFGLLVDLDLDFVVTSERLWGDHATVPSLAIYEALRDPTQRGIAQYHHRWDGHRLQALGA